MWQVVESLGKCNVGGLLSALGTALWVRFQKICMARTKTAATSAVRKAKEQASIKNMMEHGDAAGAILLIEHHGKGLRKGAFQQYKERYFLLRKGVLRWYNLDYLVTVDGEDDYNFSDSPALGSIKITTSHTVMKVDSAKDSHFHNIFGKGYGIVVQEGNSRAGERIMFRHELARDEWAEKIELLIKSLQVFKAGVTVDALQLSKAGVIKDTHLPILLSMGPDNQDGEDPRVHSLRDIKAEGSSKSILVQPEVNGVNILHKPGSFMGGSRGMSDQRVDIENFIFGSKAENKNDCADGGILRSKIWASQCSVEIEVVLTPDGIDPRDLAKSVAQGVAEDVASAVNGCRDKIWAQEIVPGSGVVNIVLLEGVCGESQLPLWVVHDLERQLRDSSSRLRQGALSSKISSLRVVAEVLHDDISFEKLQPMDQSAVFQSYGHDMRELSSTPQPQFFSVSGQLIYSEDGRDHDLDNLPPREATRSKGDDLQESVGGCWRERGAAYMSVYWNSTCCV
jgi:hypothetical protein